MSVSDIHTTAPPTVLTAPRTVTATVRLLVGAFVVLLAVAALVVGIVTMHAGRTRQVQWLGVSHVQVPPGGVKVDVVGPDGAGPGDLTIGTLGGAPPLVIAYVTYDDRVAIGMDPASGTVLVPYLVHLADGGYAAGAVEATPTGPDGIAS